MRTGVVLKFYTEKKKFGFIAPDDGGAEVFFNLYAVDEENKQKLAEGDRVEFLSEQGDRGEKATRVVPVAP